MSYRALFARVLTRLDAETAHRVALAVLRVVETVPGLAALVRSLLVRGAAASPALAVDALGLRFDAPLGLAAGFDKDARVPRALGALGFAFVEVGTITPRAQPGNPRPRLFRLPADRALVNRLGFNNDGADAVARRLERLRRSRGGARVVVGVNLGRARTTADEDAVADYVAGARRLGPLADYVVVNVSSPNTPGLRDLQAVARLRELLPAVRAALDEAVPARHVPLLVKIAPDLADEDVDALADAAVQLGLDGVVATNTTVARDGLRSDPAAVAAAGAGGLSGAPLRDRSAAVLRRLRERAGGDLVVVSVGGVATARDVAQRLAAGATLVQAYTGFVYGGPAWPSRLRRGLADPCRTVDAEAGRG